MSPEFDSPHPQHLTRENSYDIAMFFRYQRVIKCGRTNFYLTFSLYHTPYTSTKY